MRKIVIALLLMAAVSGFSQDRKWEHNIYVAGGLLIDREWGESETGVSMKLGYGLNYYFSEHWSMMPGIDIRRDTEHFFSSELYGEDSDDFIFLDVPVIAQYHLGRCYEKGIDVKVTQKWMGHSSITITLDYYTHLSLLKYDDSVEKFGNMMG